MSRFLKTVDLKIEEKVCSIVFIPRLPPRALYVYEVETDFSESRKGLLSLFL
jgi:hypothetical protein